MIRWRRSGGRPLACKNDLVFRVRTFWGSGFAEASFYCRQPRSRPLFGQREYWSQSASIKIQAEAFECATHVSDPMRESLPPIAVPAQEVANHRDFSAFSRGATKEPSELSPGSFVHTWVAPTRSPPRNSSTWTRTKNLAVNSRSLYRLSYRGMFSKKSTLYLTVSNLI